jgi:hypothetical protein
MVRPTAWPVQDAPAARNSMILWGTIENASRNPRPYSRGWNFSPAGNGTGNGGG